MDCNCSAKTLLDELPNTAVSEMLSDGYDDPVVLHGLALQYAKRFEIDSKDKERLKDVVAKYVHEALNLIESGVEEIRRADDRLDFSAKRLIVEDLLNRGWIQASEETPDWPWPITDVTPSQNGSSTPLFENGISGLKLCGYRVGATNGMSRAERKRFLDHFFNSSLPTVVRTAFGDEYGEPRSEDRLKKMANVMAAHCRNFRRNDAIRYAQAIADWEEDLAYLRDRYYKRRTFPWPNTSAS